jgi:predicted dehydrogenase
MTAEKILFPDLPYQPQDPVKYQPAIGLIGCGAITRDHLTAYKAAGYRVTALGDINQQAAIARQREYYPDAHVFTDYRQLLTEGEIEVVDVATHPDVRSQIIRDALLADKHVLSQKPFVVDLGVGRELVDLAAQRHLKLAVNQNGRWAPHFSYLRKAITEGLIGDVLSVHMAVHWNHSWVRGSEFESVRHLILYDFAIHWFDMLTCFMGTREPTSVFATFTRSLAQQVRPRLLAQVLVQYDGAQASLVFDGDTRAGALDTTFVAGSRGTLSSQGVDLNQQTVTLARDDYQLSPRLIGRWFSDGFHGTMGELLCAIEQQRQPDNSAAGNLRSLQLCFAAVQSAETGQPVVPGTVDRLARIPVEP